MENSKSEVWNIAISVVIICLANIMAIAGAYFAWGWLWWVSAALQALWLLTVVAAAAMHGKKSWWLWLSFPVGIPAVLVLIYLAVVLPMLWIGCITDAHQCI